MNRLRRALYRRGILRAGRLPRHVISIGNIAMGGSGKTPLVLTLSRRLQREGFRVAILTRGYGRNRGAAPGLVEGDATERFGDEPVLLARSLPGVDVIVDSDRIRGGLRYLETHDCDLFVLDDGFQHFRLRRDLDIVIHSADPGWLREGPSSLRFADLLVVRGKPSDLPSHGSVHRGELRPLSFRWRGDEHALVELHGKRVVAFAGLADNDQFFRLVEQVGAVIAGRRSFPDHHRYATSEIESLRHLLDANRGDLLLTTEKDAVKLRDDEIASLRVDLEVDEQLLERVLALVAPTLQERE